MLKQNDTVDKSYFDQKFQGLEEKLDWLIGKYRSHDEEHTLLNGKVSDQSDRLETIEERMGITV